MSLVNYVIHNTPSSHHDVLGKFKTFAVSTCGWTQDTYHNNNNSWGHLGGGVYGWLGTGSESFLQISSSGYGNQSMIYRFRCEASGVDPQHEMFWCSGVKPGQGTPDSTKTYHPNEWNHLQSYTADRYAEMSISPGAMNKCWFFGTSKWLMGVVTVDSTLPIMWMCGSPELFKTAEKGLYVGASASNQFSEQVWYEAWDNQSSWEYPWEYNGAGQAVGTESGWNATEALATKKWELNTVANSSTGYFNGLYYAIRENSWTGKRTLIKPLVFLQRESDDAWYPVGTFPFYFVVFTGLTIGEQISYAAEDYLVFPDIFSTRSNGIALRIA
jgi:hypothetical protein